jgi:dTDP-4-dehydrorhamnose reductase
VRQALTAAEARVIGLGSRPAAGVDVVADIADGPALSKVVAASAPELVIHAAAYTDVDGAERDPARAEAVNAAGSRHVAQAARAVGAHLVAVSTDFVFAGDGGAPYGEDAGPAPVSVYGRTKLAGERAVLEIGPRFAVARTAWLYGGPGKHFPRTVLTVLRDRGRMEVVADERGSPTFAGDLAVALVELAAAGGAGLFHLVNEGSASRFELARAVAASAGLPVDLVRPTTSAEFLARYQLPARRPADSTLANHRADALGIRLRPWPEAVAEYVPRLAVELGIGAPPGG